MTIPRIKPSIVVALVGSFGYPLLGCLGLLLCIPAGIVSYAVARLFLQDVEGPGPAFVAYAGYIIFGGALVCFAKPIALWKEVIR